MPPVPAKHQAPVVTELGRATHHYWYYNGLYYRHPYGQPDAVEVSLGGSFIPVLRVAA
jgi:hypothetical protein